METAPALRSSVSSHHASLITGWCFQWNAGSIRFGQDVYPWNRFPATAHSLSENGTGLALRQIAQIRLCECLEGAGGLCGAMNVKVEGGKRSPVKLRKVLSANLRWTASYLQIAGVCSAVIFTGFGEFTNVQGLAPSAPMLQLLFFAGLLMSFQLDTLRAFRSIRAFEAPLSNEASRGVEQRQCAIRSGNSAMRRSARASVRLHPKVLSVNEDGIHYFLQTKYSSSDFADGFFRSVSNSSMRR